ncbi:MAG: hypothetical protein CFH34_00548 [Alphaproteobacteria bacterium MarineAlpha9_Bin4]|nr:hypothetical protein [Pelagibacterales bacterium]PPR27029.1 MAG: hypothetical protein CFH34_00548 [Alphaproteobacteria bacterium MarineAlpha9_Bin4]
MLKVSYFFIFILIFFHFKNILKSENINVCIKNAVSKDIELNKILTLCRENIKNIDIYKNNYSDNATEKTSNFISTNRADEIIYEMIKKGDLNKAARLAERIESEKTKRIKAKAEAEALRAPQIISSFSKESGLDKDETNIRSVLSLGNNPITTSSAGSKIIQITTPSTHGAIPGQYVTISNVDASIDGIAASELNTRHVISSVPSVSTFTISVLSNASQGSVSGGGTNIIATFEN